jgi:hypothetical protein
VCFCFGREISIQQLFSAPKYIDVKIIDGGNYVWRFIEFYGEPKWQDRHMSWDKLRELNGQHNLPWLVLGDFNEILFSHEKEGGNPRPQHMMQAFRDSLDDCGLVDLGYSGELFPWKRGRMRQRLERVVGDMAWSNLIPNAIVHNLEYAHSDHRPILVDTEYHRVEDHGRYRPKRFEACWLREEEFRDVVLHAWEDAAVANPGARVLGKLGHLHEALHVWDRSILKKPKKRIRQVQREFETAVSGAISDESEAKAKELAELIELPLE